MKKKSKPRQYIPITVEGENFTDFLFPADSPAVKALFATAEYSDRNPRDLL